MNINVDILNAITILILSILAVVNDMRISKLEEIIDKLTKRQM